MKKYNLDETKAALAKKIREVAAAHGHEFDEKGDIRLSTPQLEKAAGDAWESADGLTIPRTGSGARTRWNKSFMGAVKNTWPVGKPFKVALDDTNPRNGVKNHSRLDMYSQMAAGEGKLPPIVVQKYGDRWLVLDGNHRVAAAKAQGLTHLDAVEHDPHAGKK